MVILYRGVVSLECVLLLVVLIVACRRCEAGSPHLRHRRQASEFADGCNRNDGSRSTIFSFIISEDALPGDTIGVLPIKGDPAGVNASIRLSITDSSHTQFVQLNVTDKTLLLAQQIDPDISTQPSKLDLQLQCSVLNLPIQVLVRRNYRIIIDILNINDNTPKFVGLPYQANISELAAVDTIIYNGISAVDRDGDNSNGQVIYSVKDNPADPEADDYFVIKHGGRGEVWLLQPLDYETKRTWEVLIEARDIGDVPRSNTTVLLLNVLDGEDLPPQFLPCNFSTDGTCDPVTYSATILEKSNVSGPLMFEPGPIQAMDADVHAPTNQPIEYSISDGFPPEYTTYFRMDSVTGEIFLLQPVYRADFPQFKLEITAQESASEGGLYVITSATVTVQEVNDHRPDFSQSTYQGFVYENARVGTQVSMSNLTMEPLKLYATDKDIPPGRPLMLSYFLSDSTAHFILEPGPDGSFAYVVVGSDQLDHEVVNNYTIRALALENDTSDMLESDTATIHITVLDINDNPPEFVPNRYSDGVNRYRGSIKENAGPGAVVMTLSTSDHDLPSQEPVVFVINYITGDGQTKFGLAQVSPSSVNLVVRENGTIAEGDQYSVSLQAVDGGSSSLLSEVVYVEIEVLAANVSHAPTFEQSVYEASASEGLPEGAFVTTVTAIDTDENEIFYNITNGNIDGAFAVDSASGDVEVAGILNREKVPHYVLTIQASDGVLSSTCILQITLLDVNDNDPVFNMTLPRDFVVVEGLTDQFVGQVMAYDLDEPDTPNSKIRYSLASTAFRVDPDTGQIFTIGALDREQKDRYELEITATDTATSPRSTVLQIVVVVQDVNDNGPVFEPREYSVDVMENQKTQGFLVLQAMDRDASAVLEYTITSGDTQTFSIDPDSGSLSLLKELDYEKVQAYNLEVTVRDTENTTLMNSTASVTVNVLDENDHNPVFRIESYQGAVLRTADLGTVAASGIRATDGDFNDTANGQISYNIMPPSVYFYLPDPSVGVVVTKTSLQNAPDVHNLTIVAFDNGNPSRSQTAPLIILVRMETPVFPQAVYMVDDLKEEEPPGTKVVELQALANEGDQIEYDIIAGDPEGKFLMTSRNNIGTITTQAVLDRENISSYSLMVLARVKEAPTAGGNARRRKKRQADANLAEVVINLVDVNDNVPTFKKSVYFVGVSESAGIGTSVIKMTAIDLDSNNNSLIEYSMDSGQKPNDVNQVEQTSESFSIDESTGVIRTALAELPTEPRVVSHMVFGRERFSSLQNAANTTVMISLINENNRAVLATNIPPDLLRRDQALLEAALEKILGAEVVIEDVGVRLYGSELEKSDPSGSDIQFYAINTETGDPFTTDKLIELLQDFTELNAVLRVISPDGNGEVIEVRRPRAGRTPISSDAELTIEAIALLCLAVALFILCILAIAVVIVSWKKREMEREKQARLYLPMYNTFNPYSTAEDHEIANPVYFDDHTIQVYPTSACDRTLLLSSRQSNDDEGRLLFEDGPPLFLKPRETQEHTMDFDNEMSSDGTMDEATAAANSIAAAVQDSSSRKSSQRSRTSSKSNTMSKTPSSSGPPSYSSNKHGSTSPPASKAHDVATIPYRHNNRASTPREPLRPPPLFDPRPTPTSDPRSPFESGSYDNYGADLGDEVSPIGSPISGARTDSATSVHKNSAGERGIPWEPSDEKLSHVALENNGKVKLVHVENRREAPSKSPVQFTSRKGSRKRHKRAQRPQLNQDSTSSDEDLNNSLSDASGRVRPGSGGPPKKTSSQSKKFGKSQMSSSDSVVANGDHNHQNSSGYHSNEMTQDLDVLHPIYQYTQPPWQDLDIMNTVL